MTYTSSTTNRFRTTTENLKIEIDTKRDRLNSLITQLEEIREKATNPAPTTTIANAKECLTSTNPHDFVPHFKKLEHEIETFLDAAATNSFKEMEQKVSNVALPVIRNTQRSTAYKIGAAILIGFNLLAGFGTLGATWLAAYAIYLHVFGDKSLQATKTGSNADLIQQVINRTEAQAAANTEVLSVGSSRSVTIPRRNSSGRTRSISSGSNTGSLTSRPDSPSSSELTSESEESGPTVIERYKEALGNQGSELAKYGITKEVIDENASPKQLTKLIMGNFHLIRKQRVKLDSKIQNLQSEFREYGLSYSEIDDNEETSSRISYAEQLEQTLNEHKALVVQFKTEQSAVHEFLSAKDVPHPFYSENDLDSLRSNIHVLNSLKKIIEEVEAKNTAFHTIIEAYYSNEGQQSKLQAIIDELNTKSAKLLTQSPLGRLKLLMDWANMKLSEKQLRSKLSRSGFTELREQAALVLIYKQYKALYQRSDSDSDYRNTKDLIDIQYENLSKTVKDKLSTLEDIKTNLEDYISTFNTLSKNYNSVLQDENKNRITEGNKVKSAFDWVKTAYESLENEMDITAIDNLINKQYRWNTIKQA